MIRFLVALLSFALLVGCTPPAPNTSSTTVEQRSANQSFSIALIALPPTLSPASSATQYPIWSALYDSLVKLDTASDAQPWSAEKWELIQPFTWRFTLRPGLVFGNGEKVMASDVAFSAKTAIANRWSLATGFGNVSEVKAIDERTVDFVMKEPDAGILPSLALLWILPEKYYTQVGHDGFAAKPIGSGPYEPVEFRSSDFVRLKKKTTEHGFRRPQPTELIFRTIAEPVAMVAGFKTGELDILYGQINPEQIETLKRSGATVEYRYSGVTMGLFSQVENRDRKTPLTDRRVRLALNYAVDRETLAKAIFQGYATPVGQFSVPDSLSWNENIKPFPYDPAQAKKLLTEAGYPNGFKLPVGIDFTPLTVNPQLVTALQGYFRDIGVDAPVNTLELAVFLDKFQGRNGQTKGDIFMQTVVASSAFGQSQRTTHSCDRPLVWWCNPEYDRLMNSIVGEPDRQKRATALRAAIAIQREDVAHLDLFAMPEFVILQGKVRGFAFESAGSVNFDSIYRID
ncbi:MAG: ABC transporter substrate-binding protein [Dehalococcoidia bacterium]